MRTAVLGAGSWGTALALQLCRAGHSVSLWGNVAEQIEELQAARENRRYLPGFPLPAAITPTTDLAEAVRSTPSLLVCAVPSHGVRETMEAAAPHIGLDVIVCSAAKGIEEGSSKRMSEVIAEATGCGDRIAVLTGPSFAREVAAEMPTVVTAAAATEKTAHFVQHAFASPMFRVYASQDPIGAEIGAAVKNVIAIAAGVSDGLGLGHNTRAAIITRGLAEVNRLAIRLGADPLTVTGLSGMGDLVLTCTGELSRNRTVGRRLGQGEPLERVLGDMSQVAEGVRNTVAIDDLAHAAGVDMPITAQMRALLFENKSPRDAMVDLMTRQLKAEFR